LAKSTFGFINGRPIPMAPAVIGAILLKPSSQAGDRVARCRVSQRNAPNTTRRRPMPMRAHAVHALGS
jgi:hypothetical protein